MRLATERPTRPTSSVRLLALLGEPPLRASQIAAALGDWTDSDGQPRLNGAEDEVYMAQTPGYLAANQPMQDVSELRLLAGDGRRALSAPAPLRLRPAG